MSFPNPDHVKAKDAQWRPTKKPGIYQHDDDGCEVEIIPLQCPDCGLTQINYHAVCNCDRHGKATAADRKDMATCKRCDRLMEKVSLDKKTGTPRWS